MVVALLVVASLNSGVVHLSLAVFVRVRDEGIGGFLFALDTVLPLHVGLGGQVHEEDEDDGGHNDGSAPREILPVTGRSNTSVGTDGRVGRIQQMDESGGHDDTGTEVPGEEIDAVRDFPSRHALCNDGE